jgi:cupin 2 domain-containing protein
MIGSLTIAGLTNLFDDTPADLPLELNQTHLNTPSVRIEPIVLHRQASPEGFWYDQETHKGCCS